MFGASDRRSLRRVEVDAYNLAARLERMERMLAALMRELGMQPPMPAPDWAPDLDLIGYMEQGQRR
jgi:hypothetical protein